MEEDDGAGVSSPFTSMIQALTDGVVSSEQEQTPRNQFFIGCSFSRYGDAKVFNPMAERLNSSHFQVEFGRPTRRPEITDIFREAAIDEIYAKFQLKILGVPNIVVLHGEKNIGKTVIAGQYYDHSSTKYTNRIWVNFTDGLNLTEHLFDTLFWKAVRRHISLEEKERRLKSDLQARRNCLVVIDDVKEIGVLPACFHCLESIHILLVTRESHCIPIDDSKKILAPLLSNDEAILLFTKYAMTGTVSSYSVNRITEKISRSPFILLIVAEFLRSARLSADEYSEKLSDNGDIHFLPDIEKMFLSEYEKLDNISCKNLLIILSLSPASGMSDDLLKVIFSELQKGEKTAHDIGDLLECIKYFIHRSGNYINVSHGFIRELLCREFLKDRDNFSDVIGALLPALHTFYEEKIKQLDTSCAEKIECFLEYIISYKKCCDNICIKDHQFNLWFHPVANIALLRICMVLSQKLSNIKKEIVFLESSIDAVSAVFESDTINVNLLGVLVKI